MNSVLFIGPSGSGLTLDRHFSGVIRPPIRRGDLDQLRESEDPPEAVGIVDGAFQQSLAVTPKEVLRALDAGVRLYGASSMGALRAVECAPYGMVGVGRIFRMYATGEVDADDEVAITFDPETGVAMSEPMVNIRVVVEAATAVGSLDVTDADLVLREAKGLYFPDRSYPRILAGLRDRMAPESLHRFTTFVHSVERPDQKRADALELISIMNAAVADRAEAAR